MSQAALARLAGVDQKTIHNIESGHNKNPTVDTAGAIARALGLRPDELFPALRQAVSA